MPRSRYKVLPQETEEGKKREEAYFTALGRFVDRFARAELYTRFALWHYAKTKPDIARAVFSGVHVDTAITHIRRVLDAQRIPESARHGIGDILAQLKMISGVRNDLLHTGAESIAEGEGFVTNILIAHNELKTFPISPLILDAMSADLRKITMHLICYHLGRRPFAPATKKTLDEVLLAPWRYKHEPQLLDLGKRPASDPPKPARKPRPERSRPPGSSQG